MQYAMWPALQKDNETINKSVVDAPLGPRSFTCASNSGPAPTPATILDRKAEFLFLVLHKIFTIVPISTKQATQSPVFTSSRGLHKGSFLHFVPISGPIRVGNPFYRCHKIFFFSRISLKNPPSSKSRSTGCSRVSISFQRVLLALTTLYQSLCDFSKLNRVLPSCYRVFLVRPTWWLSSGNQTPARTQSSIPCWCRGSLFCPFLPFFLQLLSSSLFIHLLLLLLLPLFLFCDYRFWGSVTNGSG